VTQTSFPNFVAAMNQPQISRLSGVVNSLGLAKTFSNPSLKVTVFVPTNEVGPRRLRHPSREAGAAAARAEHPPRHAAPAPEPALSLRAAPAAAAPSLPPDPQPP
jgi:hypothetical protein